MQTDTVPALRVSDLRKTYDNGVEALKGVSLDVAPGDFYRDISDDAFHSERGERRVVTAEDCLWEILHCEFFVTDYFARHGARCVFDFGDDLLS